MGVLADDEGDGVDGSGLLLELYGRVDGEVELALTGLDTADLTWEPTPGANTIGWLIWHLTRVQDHHIGELIDQEQIYVTGDWGPRFGLESAPHDIGYGHTPDQVAAVRPESVEALTGYYEAVAARTRTFLAEVTAERLDEVVDTRWDPPVTLAVRLVSIADDDIQHAGQACYVKGLLARR